MDIWFENRPVARLNATDQGPALVYDRSWLELPATFPISVSLPLGPEPFGPKHVAPWLTNLLPEGESLEVISRLAGVDQGDILGLFARIGRDTAGALSIGAPGTPKMAVTWIESEADLERIINDLPVKPFLLGTEGVSLSLAGAQNKLPLHRDNDGRLGIPINGAPSTWILKPDNPRFWGGVYNEAFCLMLARQIGLPVPQVGLGSAGARKYLLIERYDRQQRGAWWRRLHQEDLCQALGLFPTQKYERSQTGRPGPKFQTLVDCVRQAAGPVSVLQLLRYLIFNVICCNTDAHAKNYAMLISARSVTLAPIYDVMCAEVWPNVTKNLSNTIAGKNRGKHLKGRHWQREALICGLNPAQTLRLVKQLCLRAQVALPATRERLIKEDPQGRTMALACEVAIATRCQDLLSGLAETEDLNASKRAVQQSKDR